MCAHVVVSPINGWPIALAYQRSMIQFVGSYSHILGLVCYQCFFPFLVGHKFSFSYVETHHIFPRFFFIYFQKKINKLTFLIDDTAT